MAPQRRVRFRVAVENPHSDRMYRIIDDSTCSGCCSCRTVKDVYDCDQTNVKMATVRGGGAKARPKLASGLETPTCEVDRSEHRSPRAPKPLEKNVHNLGAEADLCRYFQESRASIESRKAAERSCLGYLETNSDVGFLFYYILKGEQQQSDTQSPSDVLERAYNEHRPISVEDRLSTACYIATAVPHFHSTPWLHQVWSSKDIRYMTRAAPNREICLGRTFSATPVEQHKRLTNSR